MTRMMLALMVIAAASTAMVTADDFTLSSNAISSDTALGTLYTCFSDTPTTPDLEWYIDRIINQSILSNLASVRFSFIGIDCPQTIGATRLMVPNHMRLASIKQVKALLLHRTYSGSSTVCHTHSLHHDIDDHDHIWVLSYRY